jgi:muconolactone delta-isomerase
MRWEGYVANVGKRRGIDRVLVWKREEKAYLEDLRVDGKIKLIFRKWDVGAWTGWSWLRIGSGGGHV